MEKTTMSVQELSAQMGISLPSRVRIELYTDFKNPILEQKVTAELDSYGIFYARNEVWIEDEKTL